MKFYLGFLFHFRLVPPEVVPITQGFLKAFISDDHFQFFDLYFDTLLRVVNQLNKKQAPPELHWGVQARVASLKYNVEMNLSLGYSLKTKINSTTYEIFTLLLVLLQCFPKWEHFDKVQTSTLIPVAGYVERFIKQLSTAFKPKISPSNSNDPFEVASSLSMEDMLFLMQEPLRLFMHRSEFRFCYSGLFTTLVVHSRDMLWHAGHVSGLVASVLGGKNILDMDGDCIHRLIVPFTQLMYQGSGLVKTESILALNTAYLKFLKKSKKPATEMTYLFLAALKFFPLPEATNVAVCVTRP